MNDAPQSSMKAETNALKVSIPQTGVYKGKDSVRLLSVGERYLRHTIYKRGHLAIV